MVCQNAPRGGGTTVAPDAHASLDWEAIARAVAGRTVGRRVVFSASTGSTNDDARALAAQGEAEGTVVLADEQTAGRGRAGKGRWVTRSCTSIAASVILRPHLAPAELGVLAMMAGMASLDAARSTGVIAALKWPNDVVVSDRKLGGVLIESSLAGGALEYAVVGIGLNGNLPAVALGPMPDAALQPTTLLEEVGSQVSREAVVVALLESLGARYAAVAAGRVAELACEFRASLDTLSRLVRLTAGGETIEGVAEDVSDSGALIVRLPNGVRRTFAYGDITLRPARS